MWIFNFFTFCSPSFWLNQWNKKQVFSHSAFTAFYVNGEASFMKKSYLWYPANVAKV